MATVYTFRGKADVPKYPPQRYEVLARASVGEITLYGVVGDMYDGITSKQFTEDLRKLADVKTINVHINSPGGFVHEGRAIFNRLKAHPAHKVVHVDGEASSIASLIAMAGDEIRMGEGALMLIHKAWMLTIGNEDDHAETIKALRTVDSTLIETYVARTGQKREAIVALMKENRYMDAAEAVELGFADVAEGGRKIAALAIDRQSFRLPPVPQATDRPNRAAALAAIEQMKAVRR
jgi:ATP-dependent Clp protease protease subunit